MKPASSIYYFETKYTGHGYTTEKAKVRLDIDYQGKNYTVRPEYGADSFTFKGCGKYNHNKWLAVARAISDAMEFADRELYGPKESPAIMEQDGVKYQMIFRPVNESPVSKQ